MPSAVLSRLESSPACGSSSRASRAADASGTLLQHSDF